MECSRCGGDRFRCACCEDMVDVAPEQQKWQRIGYLKGIDALEESYYTTSMPVEMAANRLREEEPKCTT